MPYCLVFYVGCNSIGLSGFDNPLRDPKTDELKKHVGQGVKIKMDDAGNILIRRYAKSNVYIKSTASGPNEETAIGADILKLPQQALESEKIVKVCSGRERNSLTETNPNIPHRCST